MHGDETGAGKVWFAVGGVGSGSVGRGTMGRVRTACIVPFGNWGFRSDLYVVYSKPNPSGQRHQLPPHLHQRIAFAGSEETKYT